MKRAGIGAIVCALLFGLLACWLGPKVITYWYAPPVGAGNMPNCTDAVSWAMRQLVWTQLIGSAAGAIVGLVVGALIGRRKTPASPVTPGPTKVG